MIVLFIWSLAMYYGCWLFLHKYPFRAEDTEADNGPNVAFSGILWLLAPLWFWVIILYYIFKRLGKWVTGL